MYATNKETNKEYKMNFFGEEARIFVDQANEEELYLDYETFLNNYSYDIRCVIDKEFPINFFMLLEDEFEEMSTFFKPIYIAAAIVAQKYLMLHDEKKLDRFDINLMRDIRKSYIDDSHFSIKVDLNALDILEKHGIDVDNSKDFKI